MTNKEKTIIVLQRLAQVIETPETELHYESPFELLVSVILSAQCTDKRVNMVTPAIFETFPDATALAKTDYDTLFPYIKSISYPASKTNYLLTMAKMLVEKHGGEVPREYDDLLELPGVGRKTANVIASVVYREARMAVDTHVFRVSNRLGIAPGKTVLEVEKQLMKNVPEDQVADAHHYLILHGRYTCVARNPKCNVCNLTDVCDYYAEMKEGKN